MTFVGIFSFIILVLAFVEMGKNRKFKSNTKDIHVGMSEFQIRSIMGEPQLRRNLPNGYFEYQYEIKQWKGIARGGNIFRRVYIMFDSSKTAINISKNDDFNKGT